MRYRRVYLIVLDGLGVGDAPDAGAYGDAGSDTLAHTACAAPLTCPVLSRLGLGCLYPRSLPGLPRTTAPEAHHARLTELSPAKDTTTGHWEMMGLVRSSSPPVFPQGFPAEFIAALSARAGRAVLGNRPASGTVIIQELGPEQVRSGGIIVYTSADSVLQIAAHVDIVPLPELYCICKMAREMLTGPLAVDRVIARPFSGNAEEGFTRTPDRRDFALPPPEPTVLDELAASGCAVIALGKLSDIFANRGITRSIPAKGNAALMAALAGLAREPDWAGLALGNLVDFDMLFGHRNDAAGLARALNTFDVWLGGFLDELKPEELVLITADHGNDPTTPSTDHSREQVPLLIYSQAIAHSGGRQLYPPPGFTHVGATTAAALGIKSLKPGVNLLGSEFIQ